MKRLAVLSCLLLGCTATIDGDIDTVGGKADDATTCDDEPTYGDGTCHIDLPCGIPDVDCFQTFASDADAVREVQRAYASQVAILSPSDSHYTAAREQVDRSFELFKKTVPLGDLASTRLSLVLVDDPTINAFVAPVPMVPGLAYWAVFVHTGLLETSFTEASLHGLIFHELAHLVNHHTSEDVHEKTKRVYLATGDEPIGAIQTENARARTVFDKWQRQAELVGWMTDALDGLPYGGQAHQLLNYLTHRLYMCNAVGQRVQSAAVLGTYSRIHQTLAVSPAQATERADAIAALDTCMATNYPAYTFQAFVTGLETDAPYLVESITTDEFLAHGAKPVFAGLRALVAERRAALLAVQKTLGDPWSSLRYFSTEEEADDLAVRVTEANELGEEGVTGIMRAILDEHATECDAILAAGRAPYGANLVDDHHGTCWRIQHASDFADHLKQRARPLPRRREAWVPLTVSNKLVY